MNRFSFLSLIIFSLTCLRTFVLGIQAPLVSLEEKNKEADTAYLRWRVDQDSSLPRSLREQLTPAAQECIINTAQLPLDRLLSKRELHDKVQGVTEAFSKSHTLSSGDIRYLEKLIDTIISPEYLLQEDPGLQQESDKTYNSFLTTLSHYKLPSGKGLHVWALRFLMSESQFLALNVIKRYTVQGKSFSQLDYPKQKEELELISALVSERFMTNLEQVRQEMKVTIPPFLGVAIKDRLLRFLEEKFIG